jgi:hypothetical protein
MADFTRPEPHTTVEGLREALEDATPGSAVLVTLDAETVAEIHKSLERLGQIHLQFDVLVRGHVVLLKVRGSEDS